MSQGGWKQESLVAKEIRTQQLQSTSCKQDLNSATVINLQASWSLDPVGHDSARISHHCPDNSLGRYLHDTSVDTRCLQIPLIPC